MSIKSFPDYKHLLQDNYVEYKHIFVPLLKLFSKILYRVFNVTFGFWMQHFQTGGLGEMVRYPGHHDRQISPSLTSFYGNMLRTVFSTPIPVIINLKARITDAFATITEDMLGEHVERNCLSIRRSPCNKKEHVLKCTNVL